MYLKYLHVQAKYVQIMYVYVQLYIGTYPVASQWVLHDLMQYIFTKLWLGCFQNLKIDTKRSWLFFSKSCTSNQYLYFLSFFYIIVLFIYLRNTY